MKNICKYTLTTIYCEIQWNVFPGRLLISLCTPLLLFYLPVILNFLIQRLTVFICNVMKLHECMILLLGYFIRLYIVRVHKINDIHHVCWWWWGRCVCVSISGNCDDEYTLPRRLPLTAGIIHVWTGWRQRDRWTTRQCFQRGHNGALQGRNYPFHANLTIHTSNKLLNMAQLRTYYTYSNLVHIFVIVHYHIAHIISYSVTFFQKLHVMLLYQKISKCIFSFITR